MRTRRMTHNRFGDDPIPWRAVIEITRVTLRWPKPLGITVHGHIIVGKEGHARVKGLKSSSDVCFVAERTLLRTFQFRREWTQSGPRRGCQVAL